MQKRTTWLIIISFSVLIASLAGSYYLRSSKNQEIPPYSQTQDEKEFLNFLSQKKKLPQVSEEVSLVAVGDISYSRGVEG